MNAVAPGVSAALEFALLHVGVCKDGLIILSQPFRWRSLGDAYIAIALHNAQLSR